MPHSVTSLSLSLLGLIIMSAFFSGSETGMMSLNRYRLRNLVRKKHKTATQVQQLLDRPDRLLGVILIGNCFANILAASLATVLAVQIWGEIGVVIATIVLTLIVLIFAETTPKTLAALYPERFSFFSAWPLMLLLKLLYPVVWFVNMISNSILRLFDIRVGRRRLEHLTGEELRTVVHEAGGDIPASNQQMLLSVLDLEKADVNDIMVPRSEIKGINLEDEWDVILQKLTHSQHTRLPLYHESIDQIQGVLHLRTALNLLTQHRLNKQSLIKAAEEPYFVPEATALNVQLLNFQKERKRLGLVVDEYGDIQGMVTLEDILEEIVGEFTTDIVAMSKGVSLQRDGSYLVDGTISLRDLNRSMNWEFPLEGPNTISGLITENYESIPEPGIGMRLAGYPVEVVAVKDNMVKTARVYPKLRS